MDLKNWEKELYDEIFDNTFDAIIADYKAGNITKEEIKRNITEHHTTFLNGFHEGARTFNTNSALIDAHELALAKINKGTI